VENFEFTSILRYDTSRCYISGIRPNFEIPSSTSSLPHLIEQFISPKTRPEIDRNSIKWGIIKKTCMHLFRAQ